MAQYLTTREVAAYLRLNEKKVYELVAQGQLPAARISGKWLFPKHLVDQWVERNTLYPFGPNFSAPGVTGLLRYNAPFANAARPRGRIPPAKTADLRFTDV
jgi:excisionase family DNA binding protein